MFSAAAWAVTETAIQGYWLVEADGTVNGFGSPGFHGSASSPDGAIVGIVATPDSGGYWLVSAKGVVYTFGDAAPCGDLAGIPLASPIVGMQATPDGGGYWLVSADGGIFPFGNARSHGSLAARRLASPIVGMQVTPDGNGYWLVSAAGGIFTFGDATSHGSVEADGLKASIVGMQATANGRGYWLAGADGGVFAFGNAKYLGRANPASPIVGIISTPDNGGYWLVEADGTVHQFGNAPFRGSSSGGASSTWGMAMSVKPATVLPFEISITDSSFVRNAQGLYTGTVTIRNISSSTIGGPLSLLFVALPPGVTVRNFSGYFAGCPYIEISNPLNLASSQQVTVTVDLRDPSSVPITITPVVLSGL